MAQSHDSLHEPHHGQNPLPFMYNHDYCNRHNYISRFQKNHIFHVKCGSMSDMGKDEGDKTNT